MTPQEAKQRLERIWKAYTSAYDSISEDDVTAFDMAISALQAQKSKTKENCDTCKHDPPSKKWPCVDCDMRAPADRWEAQDVPDTNVGDMISRQAVIDFINGITNMDLKAKGSLVLGIKFMPAVKQEPCNDAVSRKALLHIFEEQCYPVHYDHNSVDVGMTLPGIVEVLNIAPSAQPDNHAVACLLAELFDDTCACNFSDIDEWLPEKCEWLDACPDPGGVICWEQFLKHRAERRADETD